ncbi:unnamed protein product, partial [Scytosiphon promiscuus]
GEASYALARLQPHRRLGRLRHDEPNPSATAAGVAGHEEKEALGLRNPGRAAASRPRGRRAEERRDGLLDAAGGSKGQRGDRGLAVVGGDEAVGDRVGTDKKGWEDGAERGGVDLWRRQERQRRRRLRLPEVG